MITRVLAFAFGLTGAASLSQFPEFAQQYLQRLAGKVDQLEVQVAEIDASAAALDMSRDDYLEDLSASRAGAEAARKSINEISLFERLGGNLDSFRDAGSFGRLAQAYRVADPALAQNTLDDFKPAVPLTAEGAAFTAVGFVGGWGIWSMLWGILGWPLRRRQKRRAADAETLGMQHAAVHAAGEGQAFEEEEEDEAPFVEYEGNIRAAMNKQVPAIQLAADDGTVVDLGALTAPYVIFTYPLMGRPGVAFPEGWNEVDQADSATALACSFRDSYDMIRAAGIRDVFGISAGATTQDQREAVHRLALPYTLLSDPGMEVSFALDLPRFVLNHERYLGATIIVVQQGRVLAALHPIHDAAAAAPRLLAKLEQARDAYRKAQEAKT